MLSLNKRVRCLILVAVLISSIAVVIVLGLWRLQDDPIIRTKVGLIRGLKATDGDYSMFMGIPFAKVNESNPFGHSIPYPPFHGIFVAHNDSAKCPHIQEYDDTFAGTLDCLHLNIYVPNSASARNRLPVLVYIYGSRYVVGFSGRFFYGPKFLMKQDVILVTMNYRLGPYGFLCLDTPEVPGNQGLKDQVLALRWVKKNIEAFGGDANKITLAGESSGGQNVDFHIKYGDKDMFNNVIIGAGGSLDYVTITPSNRTVPLVLADDLGFTTGDIDEALDFLLKQDLNSVIRSSKNLNIRFGACLENKFEGVESFITEFPKQYELTKVKDTSFIIGISSKEMYNLYINENFDDEEYQTFFEQHLSIYFGFDQDKLRRVANYVRHFYIGNETVSEAVKSKIVDFCSDLFQNYPLKKKAEQLTAMGAKVYFDIFSYAGRRNFLKLLLHIDLNTTETCHVDELGYLFDGSFINEPITPNDQLLIDRMTTLWANFIKFGDPTPEKTDLLPVKWDSVTNEHFSYLNIDLQLSMKSDPFYERMNFWDRFFEFNVTNDEKN